MAHKSIDHSSSAFSGNGFESISCDCKSKNILTALYPLPNPPGLVAMAPLFTHGCTSSAKPRGVFEANFCSVHKHIYIMVSQGLHHLVSGTFSHLDGIKII